jgi:CRP-like cAMP-binding protein
MAATTRNFRPGQYLFREGDPSNSLYLIKKGTVAIRKKKGSAHVEIARIYSNEVIGELSFFDRLPRSASAIALTEVEVMEIHFVSLDKIYAGIPDYLKTIMAAVAERLRKANDVIRKLQKTVVEEDKDGLNAAEESIEGSSESMDTESIDAMGSLESSETETTVESTDEDSDPSKEAA